MQINSLSRRVRWPGISLGRRRSNSRQPGQALVELALSITFIALLLGAAIDLGMAYKTYQTLMNAAAEASTFLSLNPKVNCDSHPTWCADPGSLEPAIAGANREARNRFREEQGTTVRPTGSTLDLNGNGKNDVTSAGEPGWTWVADKIRIKEAHASQVTMGTGGVYGVAAGFDFTGTTDTECLARERFSGSDQCFIVVQAEIIYRPYITSRLLGTEMRIRAVSVKPIVGGT